MPDPDTGGITWTLPDCASQTRLTFPYATDEVFYDTDTGITGYGVHAGQHIEGLDHVWIWLKYGTPVRSWADGTVVKVDLSGDVEQGEYQITIDYGHNLYGVHMEVKTPLVGVGDQVTAGQTVGVGFDSVNRQTGNVVTSSEFALIDLNRSDGVYDFFPSPSTVSPFDYLQQPDKTNLINAYRENILEPYLAGDTVSNKFYPYQPYLTNQVMLHTVDQMGRLSGEWFNTATDSHGDRRDCLTFIEADNPYFQGNLVFSRNDNLSDPYLGIQGTFTVEYVASRIVIVENHPNGKTYYGIFELDESGDRPILKLEWQEGSYPPSFSVNAQILILRNNGVDPTSSR